MSNENQYNEQVRPLKQQPFSDKQFSKYDIIVMLYICKNCGRSFSLPLLKKEKAHEFLFPSSKAGYRYLSFSGQYAPLYDQMKKKLNRYLYPYINFEGFDPVLFFQYVNDHIWAELIDRDETESIERSVSVPRCPHCGHERLKQIGELMPDCQGENTFAILDASLNGWIQTPEEEQNRKIILLLKKYATSFRELQEREK